MSNQRHPGQHVSTQRSPGAASACARHAGRRPALASDGIPVHRLLIRAALHYRRALAASPSASAYLQGRGVGYAVAQRYEIGYARDAWRDLDEVLQGHDPDDVAASGLLVQDVDGQGRSGFDRFRDRLMFPIRSVDGWVAGFGGRTLASDDCRVKYINSPEGPVFKKRELVYGLYEAQHDIVRRGYSVVMEGYLDVLLSVHAGLDVAVGSLGTAVSVAQVEQLLRLAPKVVFCFDGDEAGRQAARRALAVVAPLSTEDHRFEFVLLPSAHDPASLVLQQGGAALERMIATALPLDVFAMQCAMDGCDLSEPEGRARCAAALGRTWRLLPPACSLRQASVTMCASLLGQPADVVRHLWRDAG
jgi:DNA primase